MEAGQTKSNGGRANKGRKMQSSPRHAGTRGRGNDVALNMFVQHCGLPGPEGAMQVLQTHDRSCDRRQAILRHKVTSAPLDGQAACDAHAAGGPQCRPSASPRVAPGQTSTRTPRVGHDALSSQPAAATQRQTPPIRLQHMMTALLSVAQFITWSRYRS